MRSSDNNSTSIGDVLFHAAVQLSVPTVTSTGSISTKLRSYSFGEHPPTLRKTRYSLSSLSISFSKHSHSNKRKIGRDVPMELVTHKASNHFEPKMTTTITSTPKDYLSPNRYYQYSRSTSCSSTKHNKSIKNTLFGIWQGLSDDEIQSSGALPINPKHFEERVKKVKLTFSNNYFYLNFLRLHQDGELFLKLLHHY
jgi:hypothetical protein